MSGNIIQFNEEQIHSELKDLVKKSVEETLNAFLDEEANNLVNAERYARDENRQDKSLSINAVLNGIKSITTILFPLISFPYVSRVLSVASLGQYNFSNTYIGYFSLLASLGIATYAM